MVLENSKVSKKKLNIIGIVCIIAYVIPWVVIYIIHVTDTHYVMTTYDVDYIVNLIFSTLCFATIFHLLSRVSQLKGNFKKLYYYTSVTFFLLFGIFVYLSIDLIMRWMGVPNLIQLQDEFYPYVYFDFFYIKGYTFIITLNTAITFVAFLFAIAFYLYPMERYVTQLHARPWHTYSILICIPIVPLLLTLRYIPHYTIIISIGAFTLQWLTFFNCFYLFYIYIITGIRAPQDSNIRKISFMVAFGLMAILIFFVLKIGFLTMMASFVESSISQGFSLTDIIIRILLGVVGISLFNYGFYLIKFEK